VSALVGYYWTFMTVFITAYQLCVFWTRSVRFMLMPILTA